MELKDTIVLDRVRRENRKYRFFIYFYLSNAVVCHFPYVFQFKPSILSVCFYCFLESKSHLMLSQAQLMSPKLFISH